MIRASSFFSSLICVGLCVLSASSCSSTRIVVDEDDSVDIGFGSASRNNLAYTVSEATVSEAEAEMFDNVFDYLRNKVPGVEVANTTAYGDVPHIQIRGRRMINEADQGEPLFLLDGVEYPDIQNIRPEEIHSVQVLKDAAASAYGSRGANGVIMFKTKFMFEKEERERLEKKAAREARRRGED